MYTISAVKTAPCPAKSRLHGPVPRAWPLVRVGTSPGGVYTLDQSHEECEMPAQLNLFSSGSFVSRQVISVSGIIYLRSVCERAWRLVFAGAATDLALVGRIRRCSQCLP